MSRQLNSVLSLLEHFWGEKGAAVERNRLDGRDGHGAQARDARHMRQLARFIGQMFIDAGLDESEVFVDGVIPGYFRRSKSWDIVALHKGHLVGIVELKSQVGSEGNNGNNRIEEALGNAFDAITTHEMTQVFGDLPMWSAFCMVFGSDATTAREIGMRKRPLFDIDPAFVPMTYGSQLAVTAERFIQTGAYSAGWLVTSWVDNQGHVRYEEPVPTATVDTLWTHIEARVRFAKQALARA